VRGVSGRDAVWAHPDLLPGPADLDDPTSFVSGSSISDAELEALASGVVPEAGGGRDVEATPEVDAADAPEGEAPQREGDDPSDGPGARE
jgi:hypothetical protein